jgi:hypothetical protein
MLNTLEPRTQFINSQSIHIANKWIESWNSNNLLNYIDLYCDNLIFTTYIGPQVIANDNHGLQGKDELMSFWRFNKSRFPNLRFELKKSVLENNNIAIYFSGNQPCIPNGIAKLTFSDNHLIEKLEMHELGS